MIRRFRWPETRETLARLAKRGVFVGEPRGRRLLCVETARSDAPLAIEVPLVLPRVRDGESLAEYVGRVPTRLGTEIVLLARAGAVAWGLWDDDRLVLHKVDKRYVVRGTGRAQPSYLKSKGKSRYGSRLRLMNHRALLEDTSARLHALWKEYGPADRVYVGCPVRLWAEFASAGAGLPLGFNERILRLPFDFGAPGFEELMRIRARLTTGEIVYRDHDPPPCATADREEGPLWPDDDD